MATITSAGVGTQCMISLRLWRLPTRSLELHNDDALTAMPDQFEDHPPS